MLKVNKIYRNVFISDYTHEGLGVSKIDDLVVFMPLAIKGNTYDIKITNIKSSYAYGEILNNNQSYDCKYYPQCGGCQIRHLTYDEQLTFKMNAIANTLKKQNITQQVNNIIGADDINHYRNKVIMPLKMVNNKIVNGYYMQNSHNLIPIDNCLLISELANQIINLSIELLNEVGEYAYDEDIKRGNVRYIMVRQGYNTDEVMVCFVCKNKYIKDAKYIVKTLVKEFPMIKSIVINQNTRTNNAVLGFKNFNLYNANFINEKLGNISYRIEPNTFFQVNTTQAQKLYQVALDLLEPTSDDIVLDAYCGVGSIGCFIAESVKEVVGIEINAASIKLANINAKNNGLTNTTFIAGDMHDQSNYQYYKDCNKVIVDPPRSGLDQKLIELLNLQEYEKIIYISCNPATLARDLNLLKQSYKIKTIQPVDLFPQTYHLECVVELIKA